MARATALFRLYQVVAALTVPFVAHATIHKLRRAGVPTHRAHERLGHWTAERRLGPVIWFHCASEREAASGLPLMHHIAETAPHVRLLLSTATAASAEAVAHRLPHGAVHQFSPLDAAGPLDRFLRHWRPDLCVLVNSELWPNLLDRCARLELPVALLDMRLSDSSARGWRKFPGTTAFVLRSVRYALCQDQRTRDHLRAMGLGFARTGARLASAAPTLQVSHEARDAAFAQLGGRPVWVAAPTHPGDEARVLGAHRKLLDDHPNLCLILAPQRSERAAEVAALISDAGLSFAQRSAGGTLADGAQVYFDDTGEEADLWYTLSPIVFLGGSFSDVGGHTPFAPAAAHTAIVHGPQVGRHADAYAAFRLADASVAVADGPALARTVHELLTHPSRAAQLAAAARPLARDGADMIPRVAQALLSLAEGSEAPTGT